jgi:Golgi SNAP receptor complex protein 1
MMHGAGSSDAAAAASLELQESGWEELRREARKLEGDLDVKLSSYARLAARSSSSSASSPTADRSSWKSTELEIQALLDKLQDVNDAMSRCAAPAAPSNASVSQKLARHRDILHEFTQVLFPSPTHHLCSSAAPVADKLVVWLTDPIDRNRSSGGRAGT